MSVVGLDRENSEEMEKYDRGEIVEDVVPIPFPEDIIGKDYAKIEVSSNNLPEKEKCKHGLKDQTVRFLLSDIRSNAAKYSDSE